MIYKRKGFTLIEILIVIAIIGIITVTIIYSITQNLAKSRDTRRKADIARIKVALEDYYADENQYPTTDLLDSCESQELNPYLNSLPCDPKTKQPYCYIYDADAPVGQNYRLLAALENQYDEVITELGCANDTTYCGYETTCAIYGSGYNYGVSSSDISVLNPNSEAVGSGGGSGASPTPTPTPSIGPLPSTIPGIYACSPDRQCRTYDNPSLSPHFCPITWSTTNCNNYCDSVPSYGLCAD